MEGESHPKKLATLQRRKSVSEAYLRGDTQWQIANALEINQSTVSTDLKAIRDEWLASAVENVDQIKARELAKIDHLERQYQQAWQRSCQPKKTKERKKHINADGAKDTGNVLRSEMRDGNPKFLDGVMKCIERRCQIFGILKQDMIPVQATVVTVVAGVDISRITGQNPPEIKEIVDQSEPPCQT